MVDNDANANDVRNDVDEDIVDIILDLDRDLALNGTSTFTGTVPVRSNILRMVTHLDVGYNNMLPRPESAAPLSSRIEFCKRVRKLEVNHNPSEISNAQQISKLFHVENIDSLLINIFINILNNLEIVSIYSGDWNNGTIEALLTWLAMSAPNLKVFAVCEQTKIKANLFMDGLSQNDSFIREFKDKLQCITFEYCNLIEEDEMQFISDIKPLYPSLTTLIMCHPLEKENTNQKANAAESLHHFESCLEDAEAAKKNQEAVLKRYVPNSIYQRNNFIKLTSNELHKEKNMSLRRMKTMLDTIREVQQKPVELLRTAQHADKSWFIHPPNPMALMMTMTKTCIGGLLIFIMLTVQLEDAITIRLTVSLFSMFCVGWGVLLITEKEMAELKNQNNQVVQHVRESSLQREQQQYQLQKESVKITRELERQHQQSRQRETVLEQQLVQQLLQKQQQRQESLQRIQELEQQQRQELEKSVRELDQQHQQSRQREEVLEQQLLQQLLQQQQKGQESLQLIQELEQQEQERINNNMCSICLEHPRTQVCFPCGHTCTCQSCSLKLIELTRNNNLAECPICRGDVQQFMELFFS